jgi:membrane protease YdiL (CAAX protease family)
LPKFRNRFFLLPKDKRDRLAQSYLKLIKGYKLMFILIPIYLGLLPYLLYRYIPQDFIYGMAMVILMYLVILEEYLFRKWIVKEIKKREAKELHS